MPQNRTRIRFKSAWKGVNGPMASFQVTYLGKHGISVQSTNPKQDAFNWTVWAAMSAAQIFDNPEGVSNPNIGRVYHSDGSVTVYAQGLGELTFEPKQDTLGLPIPQGA